LPLSCRRSADAAAPAPAAKSLGDVALAIAGIYTVSAADVPSAKPAKLVVGPVRTSSQNDVLLP